jgi:tetratricopeptide (TPR) repeat protein
MHVAINIKKDKGMAAQNWKEILGWQNEQIEDLRCVAYSYIRQGIYDTALTFFNAIIVLTPPTPYDLQTIGALHLQLGDGLKALDFLDRALKADTTHLPTQLNRAKALFMLGYKKQALIQARELQHCKDPEIAADAEALVIAHQ